jgi:hypothetical protein
MIFRIITAFFIFSAIYSTAFGQEPLKAHIQKTWSIDDARQEVFLHAALQIDTSAYSPVDPELLKNRQLMLKGNFLTEDRVITFFPREEMYAVTYYCRNESVYYTLAGETIMVQFATSPDYHDESCPSNYPVKTYSYSYRDSHQDLGISDGQLIRLGLKLEGNESFLFRPNGALKTHWIGSQCYRANGESCGTRKVELQ